MAYQSLYRRFRPQRFDAVVGQPHLVAALKGAVAGDRVAHAYLLSGPRGTGKTSTARILAKALNCEQIGADGEPCGECASCRAIEAGTSLDLFELDAASNNGVDSMRELNERVAIASPGRTKVYLLDEVHMLSRGASNALLKTLEEPPSHVVFVLATTDPQKVLPTIRSRTQHFELGLLGAGELESLVRDVAGRAALDVDDATVAWVVEQGRGSARDTLSALDRVLAAGGFVERSVPVDDLVDAIAARDPLAVLRATADATAQGVDARDLAEALARTLRDAFLAVMGADPGQLPDGAVERLSEQGRRTGAAQLVRGLEVVGAALVDMRNATDPRLTLEAALLRLTHTDFDVTALAARLERLEAALGTAVPPDATSAPDVTAPPDATSPPAVAAPDVAAPEIGTAPPSGRQDVAAARAALSSRPAADAAARPPARTQPPAPPPGPPPVAAAPPPPPVAAAPEPPAAQTAETPPPPPPAAPGTGGPDRDQLTVDWADHILPTLPQRVKAYYANGRFIAVEGEDVQFAVENEHHRARAERFAAEVSDAISAHYGRPLRLRLVTVGDDAPPTPQGRRTGERTSTSSDPGDPDDEEVDLEGLTDATLDSPVDRLLQAFPGAALLERDH